MLPLLCDGASAAPDGEADADGDRGGAPPPRARSPATCRSDPVQEEEQDRREQDDGDPRPHDGVFHGPLGPSRPEPHEIRERHVHAEHRDQPRPGSPSVERSVRGATFPACRAAAPRGSPRPPRRASRLPPKSPCPPRGNTLTAAHAWVQRRVFAVGCPDGRQGVLGHLRALRLVVGPGAGGGSERRGPRALGADRAPAHASAGEVDTHPPADES